MSTTNKTEEKPEWGQWGDASGKNPKLKEYFELLLKFNTEQQNLLLETKEWLQQYKKEMKK